MIIIHHDESTIYPYGLIRNAVIRDELQAFMDKEQLESFQAVINDEIVTILHIQNEFVYSKGCFPYGICEFNNSLCMLDNSGSARWRFQEIEYKINVLNKEEEFYHIFTHLDLPGFSVTRLPQEFHSVETMYYPYADSYFSLLRWKNEQAYNAIKIKKTIATEPILTRDTLIIDYTPKHLSYVYLVFGTNPDDFLSHSSSFVKKKQRHIVIDNAKGYIFGVSNNLSHSNDHVFCQIEIEYWSRLVPKQSPIPANLHDDSPDRLESHFRLINRMYEFLRRHNTSYNNIQLQKSVWLKSIAALKQK